MRALFSLHPCYLVEADLPDISLLPNVPKKRQLDCLRKPYRVIAQLTAKKTRLQASIAGVASGDGVGSQCIVGKQQGELRKQQLVRTLQSIEVKEVNVEDMEPRLYGLVPNEHEQANVRPTLSPEIYHQFETSRTQLDRIHEQRAERTKLQSDRAKVNIDLRQIRSSSEFQHSTERYEQALGMMDDKLATYRDQIHQLCGDQRRSRRLLVGLAEPILQAAGFLSHGPLQHDKLTSAAQPRLGLQHTHDDATPDIAT